MEKEIVKNKNNNLSVAAIQDDDEEEDVLYRHYNAIYGEKPELDAMLSATESTFR